MSLAQRLMGRPPERRAVTEAGLFPGLREASASRAVHAQARSYEGAKAHAAVFGCVDLLCRLICTMPVDQFTVRQGQRVEVEPSPLIASPSPEPWMPAAGWRRQVLESWLLRGYAAGVVVAERNGWAEVIDVVHPDQVGWRRDRRTGVVSWYLDGRQVGTWWEGTGPLWVAPSLHTTPGSPVGASVLAYAAGRIALGLGAQRFGSDWFDNAATPSDVYSVDVESLSADQAKELKERIKEATANREPIVMSKVMSHHHVAIAPEESQFLETLNANKADVCSYFGVPAEMVGASAGNPLTYTNVEARNLDLLTNTVGTWIAWYEATLNRMLPEGFVKFVPESLLRTTTKTRYETHAIGVRAGILRPSEARELEDLPFVEGSDVLLWPPYTTTGATSDSTQPAEPLEGP